jgi:hypothetical protein
VNSSPETKIHFIAGVAAWEVGLEIEIIAMKVRMILG